MFGRIVVASIEWRATHTPIMYSSCMLIAHRSVWCVFDCIGFMSIRNSCSLDSAQKHGCFGVDGGEPVAASACSLHKELRDVCVTDR